MTISKPILKIVAALLLVCGVMVLNQCRNKSYDKKGINGFLALFSLQVQGAQKAGILQDFDMPNKKAAVNHLINLLCNLSGVEDNSKPVFKLEVDTDDKDIKTIAQDVILATFAVKFTQDGIEDKKTTLSLKIKKNNKGAYKIIGVDAATFSKDYVAYENLVRSKTLTDKDIYSPQTLAAFSVAKTLKAKYDSIPWFQHVDGKTYYYVVKGSMNLDYWLADDVRYPSNDTVITYKMGLIDADQKEIIPVDFDLLHNIGGTIQNLIEVEKSHKRGFYDLTGRKVLPVEYDQIFPIDDKDNLAVLRNGSTYYWWRKNFSVSEDDAIKIEEVLQQNAIFTRSALLNETVLKNITEYNSRENNGSLYITPSYLVDLSLLPIFQNFKNPLRSHIIYDNVSTKYQIDAKKGTDGGNWFSSTFYSIRNYFLGGRSEFYDSKIAVIINKEKNRVYSGDVTTDFSPNGGAALSGICDINAIKMIKDSLYEVKSAGALYILLQDDKEIDGGPGYHYMVIKKNKLIELPNKRLFGFTKYIKMNEHYLSGCYIFSDKTIVTVASTEMLKFMKNEIYADYDYKFKDERWETIIGDTHPDFEGKNANVDDSLTAIDKYNIAFINKKLAEMANKGKALAAK